MDTKETRMDQVVWWLEYYLENADGWVTSAEMQRNLNFTAEEIREARAIVGASSVISCGKGYKATHLCTIEELGEAHTMHTTLADAANKNADEINAVRAARIDAGLEVISKRHERIREIAEALQRGEEVDVWAALMVEDRA